jgi:hypothetical protein
MWIILGGLAVLGVLAAAKSSSGSPREMSRPKVEYRVHSYFAPNGRLSDVGFENEQKARDYANREIERDGTKVAMGHFVNGKFVDILLARPADYNPFTGA